MDIQKNLQNVAAEIIGQKLTDANMLQLWSNYISNGVHTMDEFKNTLRQSPTYKTRILNHFENISSDYYSSVGFVGEKNTFWEEHVKSNYELTAEQFFISGDQFATGFRGILKDLFAYELAQEPTEFDINFYMDRVKKNGALLDFVLLTDQIKQKVHELEYPPISHTLSSSLSPLHLDGNGQENDNNNERNENGQEKEKEIANKGRFNPDILDQFEEVFQRPMYVQEYFKVIGSEDTTNFQDLFHQHTERYNRLREIFEAFTGKTISEYYYVNQYLFASDKEDFFDNIVNEIVEGKEYKTGMSKSLSSKYLSMFDLNNTDTDLQYIFQIVKKQKLDIKNEVIPSLLTTLKEETDSIVSKIFKVYMRVFERPPDITEIETYVNFYRNGGGDDEKLEKLLMTGTLEFHDSVKKKIRREHLTKNGREILTSHLFDVLNRVIVMLNQLDMSTIDRTISDL